MVFRAIVTVLVRHLHHELIPLLKGAELLHHGVVPCLSWCLIGVSACSAVGVSGELLDPSVITIEEFTMPVRSPSVVDLTAEQLKLYT